MSIEITIIYSPDSVLIEQSSYTFPNEGATLGRAASNFWVLEDPNKYMSSVHAKISCEAGQYFLTDMSTNGTFINGAAEPVGNGNQVILNDGDQFTISDYEFVAKLTSSVTAQDPMAMPQGNDPFADFAATKSDDIFNADNNFDAANSSDPFSDFNAVANNNDPFAPAAIANNAHAIASVETEISTDPLALLDKSNESDDPFALNNNVADPFASASFQSTNFSELPAENNSVMNESVEWPTASAESSLIPDDWDDWDDDLGFSPEPIATSSQAKSTSPISAVEPASINPVVNSLETEPSATPFSAPPANDPFAPQVNGHVAPEPVTQQAPSDPFNSLTGATNDPFSEQINDGTLPGFGVEPAINDPFNNDTQPSNDPFSGTQGNNALFSEPFVSGPEEVEPIASIQAAVVPTPGRPDVPERQLQESSVPIMEPVNQQANTVAQPTTNTRSEAEYVNLQQQNQQLRNELAELKLQLANAKQAQVAPVTQSINTDTSAALNMVVDAMGLSKWNLADSKKVEINETVGLLMRETMQGMMQVLKFRKKIKEEFRINVTTIQSVENNPLKFSANIDDALENMFIKENNAYKAPVDAVKEGFQGIAEHQVAVVAGMQAAFKGLIERFDPDHLEGRFEKYKSTGLLSLGKTKRWNAYKEYHKGLVENLDDSFQHLFGYDFVQAYEEQMQSLIRARIEITNNTESTQ